MIMENQNEKVKDEIYYLSKIESVLDICCLFIVIHVVLFGIYLMRGFH